MMNTQLEHTGSSLSKVDMKNNTNNNYLYW